jgi:hypothetical protein
MNTRRADVIAVLVLVFANVVTIAVTGLGGEYALNDDWAYAWSAKHLAETGDMRILDWAAPSLVSHIAWGALVTKVFGFSFVLLRSGTLCFSFAAQLLVFALGRRSGLDPRRALVGALFIAVSPWWSSVAFTFMSDVPWLAVMLGAMLCVARPGTALRPWLVAGLLLGVGALCRQFSLVTVPAFLLLLLRDVWSEQRGVQLVRRALPRALALVVPVVVLFTSWHLWYTRVHGPTEANLKSVTRIWKITAADRLFKTFAVLHYLGFWLVPLVLAAAWWFLRARKREEGRTTLRLWHVVASFTVAVLFVAWAPRMSHHVMPAAGTHGYFPYLGNLVFLIGVGPPTLTDAYNGREPPLHVIPHLAGVLTVLSTIGTTGVGIWLARACALAWRDLRHQLRVPTASPVVDDNRARVRLLLLGFAGAYLLFQIATAPVLFDRYLLPVLPIAALLALDAVPAQVARSPLLFAGLAAFWLFAMAGTREYLAWNGARAAAVKALIEGGVDFEDIDAGFEVNAARCFTARTKTCPIFKTTWAEGAHYRLGFHDVLKPADRAPCTRIGEQPFWSFEGDQAIRTFRCEPRPLKASERP